MNHDAKLSREMKVKNILIETLVIILAMHTS